MRLFGKVAEFSAAFALFVLVVVTIGAVFMRYFIGQPLQWTEEMSGMLMIWVVMLGGVVAQFKVTQILKVSWFWIDLAVPVGALATAIYTLYWLINDTKQSDSGDKMQ